EGQETFAPALPVIALALHKLGRADAAQEALRQADFTADRLLRDALASDKLSLPLEYWDHWLHFQFLRREAHQAIRGKAAPHSPYERVPRGRVLLALGQPDKANAEFAAAIALRPEDADLKRTQARLIAKFGHKEPTKADPIVQPGTFARQAAREERK